MQLQTYISDLLYRYDCVIVPEFGAFITQRVSAEVNTTNNTFFAPKKALLFNEQISNNDGLLTRYIADVEQIPFEAANQKISKQVQRFKSTLIEGETLYFEGIGELSADEKTESYFIILENVTTITNKKTDTFMYEEMKDKDLRILSYKALLEKFNKKYTNLSEAQKQVLKEYISNIANTNNFSSFVEN